MLTIDEIRQFESDWLYGQSELEYSFGPLEQRPGRRHPSRSINLWRISWADFRLATGGPIVGTAYGIEIRGDDDLQYSVRIDRICGDGNAIAQLIEQYRHPLGGSASLRLRGANYEYKLFGFFFGLSTAAPGPNGMLNAFGFATHFEHAHHDDYWDAVIAAGPPHTYVEGRPSFG